VYLSCCRLPTGKKNLVVCISRSDILPSISRHCALVEHLRTASIGAFLFAIVKMVSAVQSGGLERIYIVSAQFAKG